MQSSSGMVQRVEEEFGVMFADEELASAGTAGELYRLLLIELTTQPMPAPALAFLRLRRALQGFPHHRLFPVRPSTKLESLLPRVSRQEDWNQLAARSGLELAPLRPYHWVRDAIRLTTAAAAGAAFVGMVLATKPSGLLWFPPLLVSGFAGLVAYRVLFVLAQSLVLEFPTKTVGELAGMVVERSPQRLEGTGLPPLTPEQVWRGMVTILSDALAVDPVEIQPGTSLLRSAG